MGFSTPKAPFHFSGTFLKPSYFPSKDVLLEGDIYWQSLKFEKKILRLKIINLGTINNPKLSISIYSSKEINSDFILKVIEEINFRFDLLSDISDFIIGFKNDPLLKSSIKRFCGMRPSSNVSLYEYLVISTCLQNATIKRTIQMNENLLTYFGKQVSFDEKEFLCYWEPSKITRASEEELKKLKVGYRYKQLIKQAEIFTKNIISETKLRDLPNTELKKELKKIYRIGDASVWYLMFSVFKRYDAFDYVSPWEQKIFSKLLFNKEIVSVNEICEFAEKRWGKWKMLTAHYIFEEIFLEDKKEI